MRPQIKLFIILMTAMSSLFAYNGITASIHKCNITSPATQPKIQVALLLDTSNSMDGLIDQAKSQIWKMVNELAETEKNGAIPSIEIALYEYGNSRLSTSKGYIRQVAPMTNDLDLVSEKLFELKTKGGDEYCAWVIKDASNNLAWSDNHEDLKIIIIAGNEPFHQGPVNARKACQDANQRGIIINTIHCGDYQKGIRDGWKLGADLANGQYMNINQDDKVVHIPTPYDDRIIELNQSLNKTYIGYGSAGQTKVAVQKEQDSNAMSYSKANARSRIAFKSKKAYNNANWDIVDASEENEAFIDELRIDLLPEELKGKSKEEIKIYVDKKRKEREKIQAQIKELDDKAKAYIAKEQKNNAEQLTLDNVLSKTVRTQAKKKAFKFK